jgi:hypothetical protein
MNLLDPVGDMEIWEGNLAFCLQAALLSFGIEMESSLRSDQGSQTQYY